MLSVFFLACTRSNPCLCMHGGKFRAGRQETGEDVARAPRPPHLSSRLHRASTEVRAAPTPPTRLTLQQRLAVKVGNCFGVGSWEAACTCAASCSVSTARKRHWRAAGGRATIPKSARRISLQCHVHRRRSSHTPQTSHEPSRLLCCSQTNVVRSSARAGLNHGLWGKHTEPPNDSSGATASGVEAVSTRRQVGFERQWREGPTCQAWTEGQI